MNADVRRRIEMGTRVRDFCRAHPSDDPGYATLLGRLEDRLTRADALASQERAGRIAELWAAARREDLRRDMHFQLLRHLVRIGELAARDNPELAGKFRLRNQNSTHKSFLIATKAMLAEGQLNKQLFVKLGLSQTMLDELAKAVVDFEGATEMGNIGRVDHVGARADLATVSLEVVEVVELLNTVNSFRFRDAPDLAAAWDSARNLGAPGRKPKQAGPEQPSAGSPPA